MTTLLQRKDNPMNSNNIALDEPVERLFSAGAEPADTDAVWLADLQSLAYRRAATLLSIYRSRIDFLDQCQLESDIRTN
jgi:hypothetical protein